MSSSTPAPSSARAGREVSPTGSDWSTASDAFNRRPTASSSSQLIIHETPSLSLLKQKILTEDEYTTAISDIIKRDFFPQLRELDERDRLMKAYESEDPRLIEESVRRMRELVTPTPRRRGGRGVSSTPGSTPLYSDTPQHLPHSLRDSPAPSLRYDPTLSLDAFQSHYTSEDNSSFALLLSADNKKRREKYHWAWDAENKANRKAIRGREARERLVDMTRKMIEADSEGVVRMVEGAPGRPGERKLIVAKGMGGATGRLMVEQGNEERLLITHEGEGGMAVQSKDKGKGKEKQIDFVDYDRPTVEEEEESRELREDETQVPMEGFLFTNRNTLMFAPDADRPMEGPPLLPDPVADGLPPGTPKSIRYHATRLQQLENSEKSNGAPSPTRSRINAAISGTPYPIPVSATPKVGGFSFVADLPTPRASEIAPADLADLMTWGTIESTPIPLRSAGSVARSVLGEGGGPFRIHEMGKRDRLGHKLANRARKNLSQRVESFSPRRGGTGSEVDLGGSIGLRRSLFDSSKRGEGRGAGDEVFHASPRRSSELLSPAARTLLGRTGHGKAMEKGMKVDEKNGKKLDQVSVRERELESRERLKRARWSPSPSIG